jgi:hypothetical protein
MRTLSIVEHLDVVEHRCFGLSMGRFGLLVGREGSID